MKPNEQNLNHHSFLAVSMVCLILAAIALALFYYGRQHKVIIDNRGVEISSDERLRPLYGARVAINQSPAQGGALAAAPSPSLLGNKGFKLNFRFWPLPDASLAQAVEMMPRERILIKTIGPSFNLKVNVWDQAGEEIDFINKNVRIGTRRDAMVRLVKLAHGHDDFLENFPDETFRREQ
ncbi:MAG: DUF6672 family protein [Candidatus Adiutrix sp.]